MPSLKRSPGIRLSTYRGAKTLRARGKPTSKKTKNSGHKK